MENKMKYKRKCDLCNGKGKVTLKLDDFKDSLKCPRCKGRGYLPDGWGEYPRLEVSEMIKEATELGRKLAGESADWQEEALQNTVRVR